ncbi:MAG: FAD-dependent monooxygenase [Ilumatobacteraceae bacterium]
MTIAAPHTSADDRQITDHAVVIAGGGPTGMMLAAELKLADVHALIVERRADQDLDGSRAGGLHPRTIEVLDQRGVAERFISAGQPAAMFGFAQSTFIATDLPTRYSFVLALWQSEFEKIMAAWVEELGVTTRRSCEVVGFTQDRAGVDVQLSDGTTLHTQYLVGCDGGRSIVRKTAGIDFPGVPASTSWLIAEVEMAGNPTMGFTHTSEGSHAIGRRGADEPIRLVIQQPYVAGAPEPGMDELRAGLQHVYDTDFGLHSASWISRFTDATRQAATYRKGRVLVAGDAAHIHPPQGGQGMGTGIQDAVNLGWKLAQVVKGVSPDSLLDTYHDERHAVAARVLQNTRASVAIGIQDEQHHALRAIFGDLLKLDDARRQIAAMLFALDVHYDLGDGHSLLGRRMPDLDLEIDGATTRVYELLHDAKPVLLHLDNRADPFDGTPWTDRVKVIEAEADRTCDLPLIGTVNVPPAVLIRPDGHVAWTGDLADPELPVALTRWFGAAER